ncbi:MAG: pyridoxamine 5'-phosphate oxidase family protein [Sphaerochaetaceae bacterium]|nr:pyridoxamine 5'-phosphate oxidase family protein [Spirochaetales bacterium]MDY5500199.1 pyridoxamine 5'-phosphate oxidase family protein [Sphaerochaetaceae bacterium]
MFRQMRRCNQQIAEAECEKILQKEPRGVLAVWGDDGYPYTVPLDFFYDPENRKVYFHGAREGHKIDSLRRCDKVSFCVLDQGCKMPGDWALYFNSVVIFGRIRIVEDEELKMRELLHIGEKYYPSPEEAGELARRTFGRLDVLELTIEHMTGKRVHER